MEFYGSAFNNMKGPSIFDRNRNLFFWKSEFVYRTGICFQESDRKQTPIFKLLFENELRFLKTNSNFRKTNFRGGTPLQKPYRAVPPQRVRFLRPFGHKTGIDCPFWSGIGYGFRGNYGSVWTYLSFRFQMSKKERGIFEFERELKKSFLLLF